MQWLLQLLFPPRADEKIVEALGENTLHCLVTPRVLPITTPATTALLPFHNETVRACIHEAKYHHNKKARSQLASVLAEDLYGSEYIGTPVLVPIPMSAARARKRGGNHLDHIIAYVLSAHEQTLSVNFQPATLMRACERPPQVGLTRSERLENMRDAFTASTPLDPSRTYIIVDDVITTGATLQAAINALMAAGARNILPLAFAH
jgi:predicted amidophosphoribosyltransferase